MTNKFEELLEEILEESDVEIEADLDIAHLTYKSIGQHHKDLTRDEHLHLLEKVDTLKNEYTECILQIPSIVEMILKGYWTKKQNGEALSKLSDSYNTSDAGRNEKLSSKIEAAFEQYISTGESKLLVEVGLTKRLLFSLDVIQNLMFSSSSNARRAIQILEEMKVVRTELLSSILKLVATIARIRTKDIPDIVSYLDAVQYGLLCAWEVTLNYKWNAKNETPAKWSSYVYHFVDKGIARYIAEQTRPVDIPRTTLDRWSPVAKALQSLSDDDFEMIALKATEINKARKLSSSGREVKKSEDYSSDEIQDLMSATRNAISLEGTVLGMDEDAVPLIDSIQSETDAQSEVEALEVSSKLVARLKEVLEPILFDIVIFRWGLDGNQICSLDEITKFVHKKYGRSLSKETIKKLEDKARKQLVEDKELLALWREM